MTEFVDINEVPSGGVIIPKESIIINGEHLEHLINGYRTLSVSGRELSGRSIDAVKVEGRDGELLLGSNLQPRTLKVRFRLSASYELDFRNKFNELNAILQKQDMEIRFNDEPEFYYIGTLSSVGEVPRGKNTVIGEFNIYCSDGYKYTDPVEEVGTDVVEINMDTAYKTYPKEIKVVPSANTSTITLINGDKRIRLVDGSFISGDEVVFKFGDEIVVESNDLDVTSKVSLDSDLEDFDLKKGDIVQFEEGGSITILASKVMV